MPSEVVTVLDAAVEVAAARENAVVQAKSLTIDNQGGITDRVITLRDVFTPSASHGGTVTPQDIQRFRALVVAGDIITWGEEDLKGVKCLGTMNVGPTVADAVGDHCYATVGYEHE